MPAVNAVSTNERVVHVPLLVSSLKHKDMPSMSIMGVALTEPFGKIVSVDPFNVLSYKVSGFMPKWKTAALRTDWLTV